MGNLLSLDPKVHGLRADTKVFGRLFNGQEIFIIFCRGLLIEHHSIASPIYFVILDLGISLDEPFTAMNAWAMTLTLLPLSLIHGPPARVQSSLPCGVKSSSSR